MTSLSSESTISHYQIKGLIASGGMGEVYKAIDLQLGRVVALKIVLQARSSDSNTQHRFVREARAASILSHPSICTIYEIGEEGNLTFIAMQYLEGKTIDVVLREGPIRIDRALSYALDVSEALEEAHRNGVIHRDIKPSNIIINERQTAVVLDFGLAKQVNLAPAIGNELPTQMHLTSTAALVGTAPYMSPEQIRGEPLDARTDIFSLGVTLYEMIAGTRPFDGVTTVDVLHSILHDKAKAINRVRPDLDERFAGIVSRMLAKKPDERYQSAREVKEALLEYIQSKGYAVRSYSGSAPNATSFTISRSDAFANRINRFRTVFLLAPIVLVVIALVGVIWLVFFRSDSSDPGRMTSLKYLQLVNWKTAPGELSSDAVFSGDGRMIAFSSTRGKYRDIWIKQTEMGDPNQITKGEWNSWNPIWSPDSQQIAFLSKRGNQSGIWRMPALGGNPIFVTASSDSTLRLTYWSKDGKNIYYQSDPDLFKVNVSSGEVKRVTHFEASDKNDELSFDVAPAEDRIVYMAREQGQMDVWVMALSGGSPVRITNDPAEDRNAMWHPDGKRIIYSSLRDGTYQIWIANLDGSAPLQLTSGETDKLALDVDEKGSRILYATFSEESDIWSVKTNGTSESAITTEPGVELWPDVSPDGNTIVYQSIKNPDQGRKLGDSLIVTQELGKDGQTFQVAARATTPTWSPDGTRLAFLRQSGDIWNIWTVNSASGNELKVSHKPVFAAYSILPYNRIGIRFYSWSPDSNSIAFSALGSRDAGMLVYALNGLHERKISADADQIFYSPLWAADSTALAYVSRLNTASTDRSWSVWLADLKTGKFEAIFQGSSAMRLLGWVGERELLIARSESADVTTTRPAEVALFKLSRAQAPVQTSLTLQLTYLNNIQLSPDGKNIAYVAREDGKDNVWLVSASGGQPTRLTTNMDPFLYYSNISFSRDGQTIYFGKQSSSSLVSMIDNFK